MNSIIQVGWDIQQESSKFKDMVDTRDTLERQEKQARSDIEQTKAKLIQLESSLRGEEKRFTEVSSQLDQAVRKVEELAALKKDISDKTASIHSTIGSSTTLLQKLVSDVATYRENAHMASEAAASQKLVLQEAKKKLSPLNHPFLKS